MSDPILAALGAGADNYRKKFYRAPGRLSVPNQAYDAGVLEGIRWAIETYAYIKIAESEWEVDDE